MGNKDAKGAYACKIVCQLAVDPVINSVDFSYSVRRVAEPGVENVRDFADMLMMEEDAAPFNTSKNMLRKLSSPIDFLVPELIVSRVRDLPRPCVRICGNLRVDYQRRRTLESCWQTPSSQHTYHIQPSIGVSFPSRPRQVTHKIYSTIV